MTDRRANAEKLHRLMMAATGWSYEEVETWRVNTAHRLFGVDPQANRREHAEARGLLSDYTQPKVYTLLFHEELTRFAPAIGLNDTSRMALELAMQQESRGVHDARPIQRTRQADGSYTYRALSSAVGGMQIIDATWNRLQERYGEQLQLPNIAPEDMRTHPFVQARASALLARDDEQIVRRSVRGRDFDANPLTPGERYLTHFAGAPKAARIIAAADDTPVTRILSRDDIRANAAIQYNGRKFEQFTARDIREWAQAKLASHIGTAVGATSEFVRDPIATLLSYDEAVRTPARNNPAAEAIERAFPRGQGVTHAPLPPERPADLGATPRTPVNIPLPPERPRGL